MTMTTTKKPLKELALPVDKWTTVTIVSFPGGYEEIAYNYVNIKGVLVPNRYVGKIRIRALRNGKLEGQVGFDETANHDMPCVGETGGAFGACIPTPWIGARRQDTFHWQVKPSLYIKSAYVTNSRHATTMDA